MGWAENESSIRGSIDTIGVRVHCDVTTEPRPNPDPVTAPPGPHPLHAPWRSSYVESIADASSEPSGGCFLSAYWARPEDDDRNLVVMRTDRGMIILNRYPYAGGHLLVALGEGRPRLLDYEPSDRAALWSLVDRAADLVERTLDPQGLNIGINQGRAAGAGVPQHLHVHVVPRWGGDVNFMASVGQVRVIPVSLETMLARYRATLGAQE